MIKYLFSIIVILILIGCKVVTENEIPYGAIPIVYKNNHIYLTGEVDGIIGNYIFDTGVVNLCFDSTHYARSGFNYENTFVADLYGVGSTVKKINVIDDVVKFKFQENLYNTVNVPILDLKSIVGDFADGILGLEYFNSSILEINYESGYMKIWKSTDSLSLKGYSKIKITEEDNQLFIPIEIFINDTINIPGRYQLDLGSGGSVSLSSMVSEQYNLKETVKNKVSQFSKYAGAGGASSSYLFIANTLKIGDFNFSDVLMDFSADLEGAMASDDYLGISGNKVFDRFNVYIDFINKYLYLKPNNRYSTPFKLPRLGFSYDNRIQTLNCWLVTGLCTPSNAKENGLRIDDRIISINGRSVNDISFAEESTIFDKIDEVLLHLERDGNFLDVSFKLEPIINK